VGGSRVILCIQNALKLRVSVKAKNSRGDTPLKGWGKGREVREEEGGREKEGRGCHGPDQVWEEIDASVGTNVPQFRDGCLLPCNAMRKRGLCCRPVSVHPSFCLSHWWTGLYPHG